MDVCVVLNDGTLRKIKGVKQVEELPYSLEFTNLAGRKFSLAKKPGVKLDFDIVERSKL